MTEEHSFLVERYTELLNTLKSRCLLQNLNTEALLEKSREDFNNKVKSKHVKADVKKCSSLVKRIKNIGSENVNSLINDAESLNLTRYLSEIASGILEAQFKMKDCFGVVSFISKMNQLYESFFSEFSLILDQNLLTLLKFSPKQTLTKEAIERTNLLSRLYFELAVIGIETDSSKVLKVFRKLVYVKTSAGEITFSLRFQRCIFSLVKFFGFEFVYPFKSEREFQRLHNLHEKTSTVIYEYYKYMSVTLIKENRSLLKLKEKSKSELLARGALNQRTKENIVTKGTLVKNLVVAVDKFSKLLGLKPPLLQDRLDEAHNDGTKGIEIWDRSKSKELSTEKDISYLYGGEEFKVFYHDLLNLRSELSVEYLTELQSKQIRPDDESVDSDDGELLSNSKKKKAAFDVNKGLSSSNRGDIDQALGLLGSQPAKKEAAPISRPKPKPKKKPRKASVVRQPRKFKESDFQADFEALDYDDDDLELDSSERKQQLRVTEKLSEEAQGLFAKLPDVLSKELCDQFCIEFCILYGKTTNKTIRKSYLNALFEHLRFIAHNRFELIQFYARIIANLAEFFEDLPEKIVHRLLGQFKYLIRRNNSKNMRDKLDSKLRNARYIAELAKFKSPVLQEVLPVEKIFFIMNYTLARFNGSNINYLCELLDTCGKFLYRQPMTKNYMKVILEGLTKIANEKSLDEEHKSLINNVYLTTTEADDVFRRIVVKERTKVELFLEYLFFDYLNPSKEIPSEETQPKPKAKFRVVTKTASRSSKCNSQVRFITEKLLKLNWNGALNKTRALCIRFLLKAHRVRSDALPALCQIQGNLNCAYPGFTQCFLDCLIDSIERSLESYTAYSNKQKILGKGKLVAEMLNHRYISRDTFFDVLYMVLNYGHAIMDFDAEGYVEGLDRGRGNRLGGCTEADGHLFSPEVLYEGDPETSYFRIMLVCTMIMTLSSKEFSGRYLARLRKFWVHLEQHIWYKCERAIENSNDTLAYSIQSIVADTLSALNEKSAAKSLAGASYKAMKLSFKNTKGLSNHTLRTAYVALRQSEAIRDAISNRPHSYTEAKQNFEELQAEEALPTRNGLSEDVELSDEMHSDDEDATDFLIERGETQDLVHHSDEELTQESSPESESYGDDSSSSASLSSELDLDKQADLQFDRELQNLMNPDRVPRKGPVPASDTNMAIPLHLLSSEERSLPKQGHLENNSLNEQRTEAGIQGMQSFKLLKRSSKGKVETKKMLIPESSVLWKSTKKQEERAKQEQEEVKRYVLDYEVRARYDDAQEEPIPNIKNSLKRNKSED
eukprot:snap_masked-scaffold_13-processed-gene-5.20-mRNA-1 protein AED:1.00 eAED:1.00 QI:0/-1/0/0/-1/1/1/0/1292